MDYLTFLVKSRRFSAAGGIGQLAKLVINSQVEPAWQLLTEANSTELSYVGDDNLSGYLKALCHISCILGTYYWYLLVIHILSPEA